MHTINLLEKRQTPTLLEVLFIFFAGIAIMGAADGPVSNEDWPEERTEELLSVSRVVNPHPILITERKEKCSDDSVRAWTDELALMRSPLDLVSTI